MASSVCWVVYAINMITYRSLALEIIYEVGVTEMRGDVRGCDCSTMAAVLLESCVVLHITLIKRPDS